MKKICLILYCMVVLILVNVASSLACWARPEKFEVFSEDKTRVFVFNPEPHITGNAHAAVYTINSTTSANERQLVYEVNDLSSFTYEDNFYFSSDMNYFVRIFNEHGMPIFEVFSNGIRTRTVLRSDIIENYASVEAETSIGPSYTAKWRVEHFSPQDAIITINTDEGKTFFFDFVDAEFISENVVPNRHENSSEYPMETIVEPSPESHQKTIKPILSYGVLIVATIVGIIKIIVLLKRKKQ